MEKEFTDPGPYYYSGSGQFYSPQFVRSLSQAGQTSASGPGGGSGGAGGGGGGSGGFSPSGMMIPSPSGSSGGLSPQSVGNDSQQALQVGEDTYLVASLILGPESPPAWVLGVAAASVDFLVNFFEDIFGGSDNPPTPRKLLHGRHPLYPLILGIQDGLIPTEGSFAFAQPSEGPGFPSLQPSPNLSRDPEEPPASDAFPAGYLMPVADIRPLANTASPAPSSTPTPLPPCSEELNQEINQNLLKFGVGPLPDEELGCHPFITVPTPKPSGGDHSRKRGLTSAGLSPVNKFSRDQ